MHWRLAEPVLLRGQLSSLPNRWLVGRLVIHSSSCSHFVLLCTLISELSLTVISFGFLISNTFVSFQLILLYSAGLSSADLCASLGWFSYLWLSFFCHLFFNILKLGSILYPQVFFFFKAKLDLSLSSCPATLMQSLSLFQAEGFLKREDLLFCLSPLVPCCLLLSVSVYQSSFSQLFSEHAVSQNRWWFLLYIVVVAFLLVIPVRIGFFYFLFFNFKAFSNLENSLSNVLCKFLFSLTSCLFSSSSQS